tara:strand:+ start:2581 stop:2820 length:240 start_codon:yes stop_codon:yes gene_type:complete
MDCKYKYTDIERILGYSSWSDKKKVDTLLHIDCVMYTNLGVETSKTERTTTKQISKKIYKAIKDIQPELGLSLLSAMDR